MTETQTGRPHQRSWRFWIGLFFFTLGWLCPLLIPVVTSSRLTTETKTLLSGFLLVGGPDLLILVSIVFLGKSGFNYLKAKLTASLKLALPKGEVSRTRYRIGLFLLLLNIFFSYLIFYAPHLIPGYSDNRITINLAADLWFVVTLFILGGGFWEKLRALFIYDAKVYIPGNDKPET